MQLDVVLNQHACGASLAELPSPEPVVAMPPAALVVQQVERMCTGYGGLPHGTLCCWDATYHSI